MKTDVKTKWLDALRSGEYKQGKNVLHDEATDTFCCLGVLCDLAVKEGVVTSEHYEHVNRMVTSYDAEGAFTVLPIKVAEWAGLEDSDDMRRAVNPKVYVSSEPDGSVAYLNDLGYTFEQIADLIEKSL